MRQKISHYQLGVKFIGCGLAESADAVQKSEQSWDSHSAFFETGDPQARLILTQSASAARSTAPGMTIEHLGSGLVDHALASFLITMEPGTNTNITPIEHSAAEWVFCLEGIVEYEVEGQEYRLSPGDNLLFDACLSHRWRNRGPVRSQVLLILDAGERGDLTVEQHLSSRAARSGRSL